MPSRSWRSPHGLVCPAGLAGQAQNNLGETTGHLWRMVSNGKSSFALSTGATGMALASPIVSIRRNTQTLSADPLRRVLPPESAALGYGSLNLTSVVRGL
jgi:hypothetical protein